MKSFIVGLQYKVFRARMAFSISCYVFQTADGVGVELNGGTGDHDGFVDMFGDDIRSILYIDTETNMTEHYYPAPNWQTLTAEERNENLFVNISNMWRLGGIDNLEFTMNSDRITYFRGQNGEYDERSHIEFG